MAAKLSRRSLVDLRSTLMALMMTFYLLTPKAISKSSIESEKNNLKTSNQEANPTQCKKGNAMQEIP